MSLTVDDIPVASTPEGGWTEWPGPFLADCNDPIPEGAPDLDGWWRIVEAEVDGEVQPEHPILGHVQRIEQRGDRVIVTSGGVVHDMRCDGTLERGVNDVAEFDKATEIHVVATFEDGVHTLRPDGMPIEVLRWRDGDHLRWQYVGFTARLDKLAPSTTLAADIPELETV